MKRVYSRRAGGRGFTLIEVLTATAILSVLVLVSVSVIGTMQRGYAQTKNKVEQFREARIAFETISRHLSQATLAPYWDYYYSQTGSNVPPAGEPVAPSAYVRRSDLHFISGPAGDLLEGVLSRKETTGHAVFFQAPLGLTQNGASLGSLLNARGYAIQLLSDEADRPPFIHSGHVSFKKRWRLVEFRPPAEKGGNSTGWNAVFERPSTWFRDGLGDARRVVADNILLLLFSPQLAEGEGVSRSDAVSIAPRYHYNSRDADNSTSVVDSLRLEQDGTVRQGTQHLLPPLIRVTLVAADETSVRAWTERHRTEELDLLSEAGVRFDEAEQYHQNMAAVEAYLQDQKIQYHTFTALVSLRNARWDSQPRR